MKVKELLSDENKWTKGAMARDIQGTACIYSSLFACCWCLHGAIDYCYPNKNERSSIFILVKRNLRGFRDIVSFNDNETIFFGDVKALVNELDI